MELCHAESKDPLVAFSIRENANKKKKKKLWFLMLDA